MNNNKRRTKKIRIKLILIIIIKGNERKYFCLVSHMHHTKRKKYFCLLSKCICVQITRIFIHCQRKSRFNQRNKNIQLFLRLFMTSMNLSYDEI